VVVLQRENNTHKPITELHASPVVVVVAVLEKLIRSFIHSFIHPFNLTEKCTPKQQENITKTTQKAQPIIKT